MNNTSRTSVQNSKTDLLWH